MLVCAAKDPVGVHKENGGGDANKGGGDHEQVVDSVEDTV